MRDLIIFDFAGTLVKMRPPRLLVNKNKLFALCDKYALGIITGARKAEVLKILNKLEIVDCFSILVAKDDCKYQKPERKLFLFLRQRIKFGKVYYVGDTLKDYKFAVNSGIPFLYVGKKKIGIKNDISINNLIDYLLKLK